MLSRRRADDADADADDADDEKVAKKSKKSKKHIDFMKNRSKIDNKRWGKHLGILTTLNRRK